MLFERYQPIVFRHVLSQTGQTDLSHDIVQETFLRIWIHRSSLKPDLPFMAFALRISGNLARDAFRHRRTRERLERSIPPPALSEGDDPAEALQLTMLEERLTTIINEHLPERCRTIFLLSRVEEKTHREIADLLGLSVKTVENQIHHALKLIRRKIRTHRE